MTLFIKKGINPVLITWKIILRKCWGPHLINCDLTLQCGWKRVSGQDHLFIINTMMILLANSKPIGNGLIKKENVLPEWNIWVIQFTRTSGAQASGKV